MSRLVIVSGPSGSGKTTVIARLIQRADPPMRLSVSATTRPPRPGETDGVQYHFWDRPRFEKAIAAGEFLEYAEVHGNLYGTLKSEATNGSTVILDIDVQGAEQVRRTCPEAVSIFLLPPSFEVLEQRLRARHTENEAAVERRLANARVEVSRAGEYSHRVFNDAIDETVAEVQKIVKAHVK
jgi:guanylate kinase